MAKVVAGVLSVALPAARAMAHVELGDEAWKKIETELNGAKESLSGLVDSLTEGLVDVAGESEDRRRAALGRTLASAATLRRLHDLLLEQDASLGGLVKVRNNRREPMWIHPRFESTYHPPPPTVPEPVRGSSSEPIGPP